MLNFRDLFKISFKQVCRQKRRNLGILITIAIGTASMISILTMGQEVKKNLNRDLDLLGGATVIKVFLNDHMYPGERQQWFTPQSVDAIRSLPGVVGASLTVNDVPWLRYHKEDKIIRLPVMGVDDQYWVVNDLKALTGRLFTPQEVSDGARVCVLGVRLAKQIFGTVEAAVGKFVSVREEYYQVVGVVSGVQLHDQEQFLFAPVTTVVARKYANVVANRIYVRCRTWDDVKPVAASLETTIRSQQVARHLVIEVGWEQLERLVSVIWWVELFIYVASAVTLSLGGFGIWNGMMSSVTARTREIGLKKSMGAEDSDILKQFLSEALLLSVVAVVVGVGLGRAIVVGVSKFLSGGIPDALFIRYSLACLAFSILLGLVAGFYPALRASKLDVVAALKFE